MLRRFALIALLIITSSTVLAQYDNPRKERSKAGSRDGRWEGSVILAYQTGLDPVYGGGAALEVDSTTGWGFSVGWNWTDKWNLSYRLVSTSPKYTALVVPEDENIIPQVINHKMDKMSHQFNVTYNFSRRPFTP